MSQRMQLRGLRSEDEERAWDSFMHYAFEPEKDVQQWLETRRKMQETAAEEKLGYYRGDEMVAACGLIPFRGRLRGSMIPLGAVSDVATPPENRFQGHARNMLRELLLLMRERNLCTSVLWPFYEGFYAAMGWVVSADHSQFKFSEKDMHRLTRDFEMNRTFSQFSGDDPSDLNRVHSAWGSNYELTIERDLDWWQTRVLTQWDRKPYVYVCRNTAGDPVGYLAYFIEGDWEKRTLVVVEMAYVDLDTYRAQLRFLAGHVSQVRQYRITVPPNDPLWDWHVTGKVVRQKGIMFRIVDVMQALEFPRYPESVRATVTVAVRDPFADWNDGVFRFNVQGGKAEVTRDNGQPDFEIGIGALSQMFTGHRSAGQLVASGALRIACREVQGMLSRVFPPRQVYMMEEF